MNDKPNKKVRNATLTECDGIKFKSKLERYTYEQFKLAEVPISYETVKFTLLEKFKYNGQNVRAITYTPDFIGEDFIVECKGFKTDRFVLKWKLFQKYLLDNGLDKYKLYLVHNQKQVRSVVEEIRPLAYVANTTLKNDK
jgi:hypothetical protein